MTRILLIRHGETDYNKEHVLQGWLQNPLNKNGIEQTKKLANRLKKEKIDVIYTSQLKRAVMTGEIIAKKLKKKIRKTTELNERYFGDLEGQKEKDVSLRYPEFWKRFRAVKEDTSVRPPGGESTEQMYKRVTGFVKKILDRHKGKTILITAHGGVNQCLLAYFLKMPLNNRRVLKQENACINEIRIQKGIVRLHRFNDVAHLRT
jgi:broad specificity phosphatase PhoE